MNDPKQLLQRYEPKEIKALATKQQLGALRFSPCGKFLVGGGYDGLVHRWDVSAADLPELSPLEGHGGWVEGTAFQPNGELLFTADTWGRLFAWPYTVEKPEPKWKVEAAHDGWIRQLAASPDGKLLATCGIDRRVRVWSADDGSRVHDFDGHQEDVFSVCFAPDGKSLVSGDLKGVVKQWDLANGTCVRDFDARALYAYYRIQDVGGVRCLAFNRDGTRLACAGTRPKNDGNVQGVPLVLVFDFATGELKQTIEMGNDGDVYVCDLAWHADGFLMAVTSGNPGTGKFLFQYPEDKQPFFVTTKLANCHSLSVHPDGRRLAVAATSKGSNGNGRPLNKDGQYEGNTSPIHLFELPAAS
jgi:WD40 repeat protein